MLPEPLAVTLLVVDVLEQMGVPYLLGGSLAGAVYGVARATLDADLVADLRLDQASPFTEALSGDFYVDAESVRDAVRQRGSFNVIHLSTMFKVDIFIPKQRPFDRDQLDRRILQTVGGEPSRAIYFASPEDTVLAKLDWYRLGGEVSDRQWRDVLGILAMQRGRLDLDYLRRAAISMQISDLLAEALGQAAGSGPGSRSDP